ncbi:phage integrase [Xylella fastidiosa]|uniref:phage integrase n=1 Tax=Xylella fastidiosa TaxID=2371 RepID=UPI00076616D0|nr:tyrosine-type recombinase/integrase [Xylella fastidiosa]KXB21615.1 integrase [Xylella fastidiosa]
MRRKSSGSNLPPKMLCRKRKLKSGKIWMGYYYNGYTAEGRRIEIPLGTDVDEARIKWAELASNKPPENTRLVSTVIDRYLREVLPTKARSSQKRAKNFLNTVRKAFGEMDIGKVTTQHIAAYRDTRSRTAPVSSNRELSYFSMVWNMALEWGYTANANPIKGLRKNKETPREFYVDDAVWTAVYRAASDALRDAMDLAYITAQRPADVLKMRYTDISDGALELRQNKTKKRLRILLEENGEQTALGGLINRIKQRNRQVSSFFIIATPQGVPLNSRKLADRFQIARSKAATLATEAGDADLAKRILTFQFRDIRSKAASELPLDHASKLLGHTKQEITQRVYRRKGEVVSPNTEANLLIFNNK